MKLALASVVLLVVCLLTMVCYAQITFSSQYVGGEFGRNWLNNFNTQNPQPPGPKPESGLWSWGGAPKGSIAVNGRLIPDPYYFWKSLNYTSGWMGRAYVDPYTGYPIYAYRDPYTGWILYFYVDPNTGRPVYTYPYNGAPIYGSGYPFY
ncbi:MAG: hypothetical protein WB392_07895 [Methanotrichaceae archaeon]